MGQKHTPFELAIGERRDAKAHDLGPDGQLHIKVMVDNHLAILAKASKAFQRSEMRH